MTTKNRPLKPRHRSGAINLGTEQRTVVTGGIEIRSAGKDETKRTVRFLASRANTDYEVHDSLGTFTERILSGAAADVLADPKLDCRHLFNHSGLPLGRTTNGSLRLRESSDGLEGEVDLDLRQQVANDVAIGIENGTISQCSFAFTVAKDTWNGDWTDRSISKLGSLLDTSFVTYPASPTTSIEIARAALASMPEEARARLVKASFIARELRAGKTISAESKAILADALSHLASASSGIQGLHDLDAVGGPDGTQGGSGPGTGPTGSTDGGDNSGSRAATQSRIRMNLSTQRAQSLATIREDLDEVEETRRILLENLGRCEDLAGADLSLPAPIWRRHRLGVNER